MQQPDPDLQHMQHAVRLAIRGHGNVEPNPMVGCVIVQDHGNVVGWGGHARFGEDHAEIVALKRAGERSRGATMYVTLEPCNHQGKTPPCADAVARAGLRRVIIGVRDPNPVAVGGIEVLKQNGIEVIVRNDQQCVDLIAPWVTTLQAKRPWIVAKWAQTIDGRIATRSGHSQWISQPRSRRAVHRERGRVDAILTGIGTVFADDPQLTARQCHSARRAAIRVVVDHKLQIPTDFQLVRTAAQHPTIVACHQSLIDGRDERVETLRANHVTVVGLPMAEEHEHDSLRHLMNTLHESHGASTLLVEAGGGLLGKLAAADLIDEAWVFIAPMLLGDDKAPGPVRGLTPPTIGDCSRMRLVDARQRDGDLMLRYRREQSASG